MTSWMTSGAHEGVRAPDAARAVGELAYTGGIALAPGHEPPTDEKVEQWPDERRMKEAE